MPDSSQRPKLTTGRPLPATVRRLSPAGVIVSLPDGRLGLVRARELGWDAEARQGWRERYRPGDSLAVVILKEDAKGPPELSARLAQSDPWEEIERHYRPGALVDAVVTGIMSYGIFVELETGVTGLVHTSRFPVYLKGEPGELFWPGDLVKVVVDEIDAHQRQMTLHLANRAAARWDQPRPANTPKAAPRPASATPVAAALAARAGHLLQHGARSILVADDSLGTRSEISDWLRNAGHQVVTVGDGAAALAALQDIPLEIALVDLQLPQIAGIQVVQAIRRDWPEMRCILMSGNCEPDAADEALAALLAAGVPLLCKPLRPDVLLEHLFDGRTPPADGLAPPPPAPARTTQAAGTQLAHVIRQLWRATRVGLVVLFELDPYQRKISIVEQYGRPAIPAAALPAFIHSPVRDVAEDGRIIRAASAAEAATPRFRHLAAHLYFASCLGLPVDVALPLRYALFLFSDQPDLAVNASVETFAAASAIAAAAWLERDAFGRQAAEMHRLVLLGQLGRTLVHEINNQVQNIPWAATRLPRYAEQIRRQTESNPAQAQATLNKANELLQDVSIEVNRLAGIARPFAGLAQLDHQESLLLDTIVEDAVRVVKDTAQRANVSLEIEDLAPLAYTRGQDTALHQVLVNLLLNAVQQIEQERGRGGGRVAVRLTAGLAGERPRYWISIEDDGPGIHRRLWERIFDMGFSTRPGGSGVGLQIARSLIQRMGGQIYVAESWLGWGSRFVIDLPG